MSTLPTCQTRNEEVSGNRLFSINFIKQCLRSKLLEITSIIQCYVTFLNPYKFLIISEGEVIS